MTKPTAQELRVAKAIQWVVTRHDRYGNRQKPLVKWRELDVPIQRAFVKVARIAIKAMRKP